MPATVVALRSLASSIIVAVPAVRSWTSTTSSAWSVSNTDPASATLMRAESSCTARLT